MTWAMLGKLLMEFGPKGFDLAEHLIEKWSNPEPLTLEDIAKARKLGERSKRDAVIEALVRAGEPLDSPKAVALLALVP